MINRLSAKIVFFYVLVGGLTAFAWTLLAPMHRARSAAEDPWRVRSSRKASGTLADELGLNAGEKARLEALKSKHMPDFQILIHEAAAPVVDRKTLFERMNLFKNRFYADLLNILRPEQQARFLEIMVNEQVSGGSGRRGLPRTVGESKGRIWI